VAGRLPQADEAVLVASEFATNSVVDYITMVRAI
jgi:hypothetical protein